MAKEKRLNITALTQKLQYACKNGHITDVNSLIEYIAKIIPDELISIITSDNYSCFEYSCEYGHYDVVKIIIETMKKYNPKELITMMTAFNYYGFDWACRNEHFSVAKLLFETFINYGYDEIFQNQYQDNCILYYGYGDDIVKLCIEIAMKYKPYMAEQLIDYYNQEECLLANYV